MTDTVATAIIWALIVWAVIAPLAAYKLGHVTGVAEVLKTSKVVINNMFRRDEEGEF